MGPTSDLNSPVLAHTLTLTPCTNIFGAPKEAYGYSNNVRPKFRAAYFNEAAFLLNTNKKIKVNLSY